MATDSAHFSLVSMPSCSTFCDSATVLLQVADEHQLTLNLELPQASRAQAQAAPKQKAAQSEQQDDLTARLAELRGR